MKRRMKRHAVTQPLDQSYRLIPLTQGQNAIVDASDFEWLDQWNWSAHWNPCTQSFYAARGKTIAWMHRLILGCSAKERVDHMNHDTLDNRRDNLRKCTHGQNMMNKRKYGNNTSGYKGVYFVPQYDKWLCQINLNNKCISLGYHSSKEEAAHAYDRAAKRYFGEFAQLNFPVGHGFKTD